VILIISCTCNLSHLFLFQWQPYENPASTVGNAQYRGPIIVPPQPIATQRQALEVSSFDGALE